MKCLNASKDTETLQIDTKNIMFILSGAFVGLDETVRERMGKTKIGFTGTRAEDSP